MTGKGVTGRGVTAEQAARAIVAACMLLGVDPAKAFETSKGKAPGGRKARMLAAHGVRARLGVAPKVLVRVFALAGPELSPSWGKKAGFTTDQLLAISEALGPVASDDARGRFLEPHSGVPCRSRPDAGRRTPDAGRREVRAVTTSVNPLLTERPKAVRYASWFLEADWPLKTVARLFDVEPRQLLDALDPEGAR